jgi:membrane protein
VSILVLTFIYRVAARRSTNWRSVLPGAAAATILWWVVNLLLGAYVRKMHYGPIYGGIAAVFGLMIWMEFATMIVFLGAAWNAESSQ